MRNSLKVQANKSHRMTIKALKKLDYIEVDKDAQLTIVVGDELVELSNLSFSIKKGSRLRFVTRQIDEKIKRQEEQLKKVAKEEFHYRGNPRTLSEEEMNKPLHDKILGEQTEEEIQAEINENLTPNI